VYLHEGTLFAVPFDLARLEFSSQPVPVLEAVTTNNVSGAQYAVSNRGTLVYLPGSVFLNASPISWMDRAGKTTTLRAMPADWSNPRFDPTGETLAVDISDGKQTEVWTYEWTRDTLTRMTFNGLDDRKPVWTPDGRRMVFSSTSGDKATLNLYWRRTDGTGDVQRLTESKNSQYAASWHASGKFLAFFESNPQTSNDLMILPIEGDEATGWKPGKATAFLNTPANELEPMFSPDGRWLAYASNESGRQEVFVRPFPGPGGKWQISTGGGFGATWSRTKSELLYGTPDRQVMVASYSVAGDSFRADKPRLWSETHFLTLTRNRSFDLHPDGERLAVAAVPEQTATKQDKVVFVFNFFDELRRLAPPSAH
jgi:dipeptidyl aminopeptidase/acylaminoacyl peptidase